MSVLDCWLDEAKKSVEEKTETLRDLVGTVDAVNQKMVRNNEFFEKYPNFAKEACFLETETEKIGAELTKKRKELNEKNDKERKVEQLTEELVRLEEELKQLKDQRIQKEQKLIDSRI